jgi:hypothetical protein
MGLAYGISRPASLAAGMAARFTFQAMVFAQFDQLGMIIAKQRHFQRHAFSER